MLKPLFKLTGAYFFGSVISQILATISWIIIARLFLPSQVGQLVLFINSILIVTFFADFGLNQWYQKNVSAGLNREETFQKAFAARITTLFISLLFTTTFLIIKPVFNFPISILLILLLIVEALTSISDGYYLEKKRGYYAALKKAIGAIPLICFLLIFRKFGFSENVQLFLAFFIAELMVMIWLFPWRVVVPFKWSYFKNAKETLAASLHYGLLIVSSFVYARGDSIIIGFLAGTRALGLYSMSYRFLEALSLFPAAMSQNLFHISAKKDGTTKSQLFKITIIMGIIGGFIAISLFFSAPFLIIQILGMNYIAAVPLLQIFSPVVWLFFVNAPLATVVQSSAIVRSFLPWGVANTLINLTLNIIFIPLYGVQSAAFIMLITELTGLIINLYFVKQIYTHRTLN